MSAVPAGPPEGGDRGGLALRIAVAAVDFVCGGANVGLGGAHLFAVLSRAWSGLGHGGAARFAYDFHFVSLLLVGALLVIPGLLCLFRVPGLVRGRRAAWRGALWSTVVLVALNGALLPIQGFAVPLGGAAAVNLVVLLLSGRRFVPADVPLGRRFVPADVPLGRRFAG